MLKFTEFIAESPHETVGPVPVKNFLPLRPDLRYQPLIPDIVTAVKTGVLKTRTMNLSIKSLIPTQERVSLPKVQQTQERPIDKLPLVLLERGTQILLDGHHRICAEVLKGESHADVLTLTASQLYGFLKHAA